MPKLPYITGSSLMPSEKFADGPVVYIVTLRKKAQTTKLRKRPWFCHAFLRPVVCTVFLSVCACIRGGCYAREGKLHPLTVDIPLLLRGQLNVDVLQHEVT